MREKLFVLYSLAHNPHVSGQYFFTAEIELQFFLVPHFLHLVVLSLHAVLENENMKHKKVQKI